MSAIISDCGLYRYNLSRNWGTGYGTALFIMLNPSTADAENDDPTIRRCIGFARRLGYAGLEVVNLFAFRATNPAMMKASTDPVGPDNRKHVIEAAERAGVIIAAWGANGKQNGQDDEVLGWLSNKPVSALGLTKDGIPRHPLYLRSDSELVLLKDPTP